MARKNIYGNTCVLYSFICVMVLMSFNPGRCLDSKDHGKSSTPSSKSEAITKIQDIERYMNSFRTLKARFTQFNPDKTSQYGSFYLWRPGRMRLAYDAVKINKSDAQSKTPHLMVADGDTLFDYYPQLDELTEIPLNATPASFILRDKINFNDDIEVIDFQEKQGIIKLSLVRRDDHEAGILNLTYNAEPLVLTEWEIIDSQKNVTRVVLDDIQTGIILDSKLFDTKNLN